MKTFVLLAATVAVCLASAIPGDEGIGKIKTYPRYIEFPDVEGNMRLVDLEAPVEEEILAAERNGANNQYWLYERSVLIDRSHQLVMGNANSVHSSNINWNRPTVVLVHGWTGSRTSDINEIRAGIHDQNVNVISVDWSRLAGSLYNTAAAGVPDVGVHLCRFLQWLQTLGLDFNRLHLVGFSLGAHAVGSAGRTCGGRIAVITGLDPAGPLWNYNSNRLNPNDGVYVEAIHTDGGPTGLGIGTAIANVDWFVNGGSSQPGCYTSLCNHNRAFRLFEASTVKNHTGQRCSTTTQITWGTCRGVTGQMGTLNFHKSITHGMYRVDTGRSFPF